MGEVSLGRGEKACIRSFAEGWLVFGEKLEEGRKLTGSVSEVEDGQGLLVTGDFEGFERRGCLDFKSDVEAVDSEGFEMFDFRLF